MNTCKTCKYWTTIKGSSCSRKEADRLHFCNAPKIKYGYGIEECDISDDGVLIEEDEGWGMLTGPDFGCIHHEIMLQSI